ncbi:MAG: hypothetical protein AB1505_20465 [Candidatus Latescibacterota bacterium]
MRTALLFVVPCLLLGYVPAARAQADPPGTASILYLHHSTGKTFLWAGLEGWFTQQNAARGTDYRFAHFDFPKHSPYGWANYPFEYWDIWVQHAGPEPYQEEPTLEVLTPQYNVIIWKHCYYVGELEPDTGTPDITSPVHRVENYKLQYEALKAKMRSFPNTRFLVWTGAALLEASVDPPNTPERAQQARAFFEWVRDTWDKPGDNIFLWDFYELETEGGVYLKPEYARGPTDNHPSIDFARALVPLLGNRVVDVIEGRGDTGGLTGDPAAVTREATALTRETWGEVKAAGTR